MKVFSAIAAVTLLLVTGCGINRQLELAKAFENCEYAIVSADSITVAGTDINKMKDLNSGDLSKMPKLALALLTKNVPLRGRVNLRITNPSGKMAGINQFEYKVLVKGTELANGFVDRKVAVEPGGGTTVVPIRVNANIYNLLTDGKSLQAIMDFMQSGKETGTEKKGTITIKIKPTLDMAGKQLEYPGYITIDKEISSKLFL